MPVITMLLEEGTRRSVHYKGDVFRLKGMVAKEVPDEIHDYLMSLNEGKKFPMFASGGLLVEKRATNEVEDELDIPKKKPSTKKKNKRYVEEEEVDEEGFGEQKEF